MITLSAPEPFPLAADRLVQDVACRGVSRDSDEWLSCARRGRCSTVIGFADGGRTTVDIDRDEALRLLASVPFGRVAIACAAHEVSM